MCGRIGQFSAWQSYIEALQIFRESIPLIAAHRPRFNVGPGTRIATILPNGEVKEVWWGYRPHWAVARKIPQMINARGDKITGATWKQLLQSGRVIVPADCWYEWIKTDDGKKQPFLLRAKDSAPLYLAGLCNNKGESSGPRETEDTGGMIDGVVIVTDKSDQGMVDLRDAALTAADARHWLDPDTTVEKAPKIAHTTRRPIKQFEQFEIERNVNLARNDSAYQVIQRFCPQSV